MCRGTYFTQNGNAGACGKVNPDSAVIVALFTSVYAGGKHCGAKVQLTNVENGKTVVATVAGEKHPSIHPFLFSSYFSHRN
jgi:hypothetical protein